MGTFVITQPAVVNTTGGRSDGVTPPGWFAYNGSGFGSTDADMCEGIVALAGFTGYLPDSGQTGIQQEIFGFDQSTPVYVLDSDPAISYNLLPSGLLVNVLQISLIAESVSGGTPPTPALRFFIDSHEVIPNVVESMGVITYTFDCDVINEVFAGASLSPNDLLTLTLEMLGQISDQGGGTVTGPTYRSLVMEGEYIIFAQTFSLDTPGPVNTASPVTITSDPDDPNAMDFEQIQTVDITYNDSNGDPQTISVPPGNWITQNTNLFVFILPTIPTDAIIITIVVTSTQFSGSISLGQLTTIYLISASGIYRLVTNKRNDTVYNELELPSTINVKIPDPFARGGFIGSDLVR